MQKIGKIIDGLEVHSSLDEGDLVAGCVVILKVVEDDGQVRISTCWASGTTWIDRLGMLHAAIAADTPPSQVEER